MVKSHSKKDGKISTQSSQIKDPHMKLDQAVAENSQIREFLNPTSLWKAFTSALQAAQTSNPNKKNGHRNPFWGKCREPQFSAGIDGTTDSNKSSRYCKDTGYKLGNCIRLQARKEFLAHWQQQGSGLS